MRSKEDIISEYNSKKLSVDNRDTYKGICDLYINAEILAIIAHTGQKRKGGAPFITHPEAVVDILNRFYLTKGVYYDQLVKIAAILHDVVEDTDVNLFFIDKEFGSIVSGLVSAVTCFVAVPETIDKVTFWVKRLSHFKDNIHVLAIKLADWISNTRDTTSMKQLETIHSIYTILKVDGVVFPEKLEKEYIKAYQIAKIILS